MARERKANPSAVAHRVRASMAHGIRVRLRCQGRPDAEGVVVRMPHAGAPTYAVSAELDSGEIVSLSSVVEVERA